MRRGFSVGSHLVRRCRKWCTLDILFFVLLLSRRKASPSGLPAHMQKSHGGLLPVEQSLPLSESLSDSLCRVGDPAPPLPERRRGAPVRRSTGQPRSRARCSRPKGLCVDRAEVTVGQAVAHSAPRMPPTVVFEGRTQGFDFGKTAHAQRDFQRENVESHPKSR